MYYIVSHWCTDLMDALSQEASILTHMRYSTLIALKTTTTTTTFGGLFNALSIFVWNLESMSIFTEMPVGILMMNVCSWRLAMKRISTLAVLILSCWRTLKWSVLIFANLFYWFSKAFTTKSPQMTSCIYVSTAHVLCLVSVHFRI